MPIVRGQAVSLWLTLRAGDVNSPRAIDTDRGDGGRYGRYAARDGNLRDRRSGTIVSRIDVLPPNESKEKVVRPGHVFEWRLCGTALGGHLNGLMAARKQQRQCQIAEAPQHFHNGEISCCH